MSGGVRGKGIKADGLNTDGVVLLIQVQTSFIDISLDTLECGMFAFLPSGIDGHIWRMLRHTS